MMRKSILFIIPAIVLLTGASCSLPMRQERAGTLNDTTPVNTAQTTREKSQGTGAVNSLQLQVDGQQKYTHGTTHISILVPGNWNHDEANAPSANSFTFHRPDPQYGTYEGERAGTYPKQLVFFGQKSAKDSQEFSQLTDLAAGKGSVDTLSNETLSQKSPVTVAGIQGYRYQVEYQAPAGGPQKGYEAIYYYFPIDADHVISFFGITGRGDGYQDDVRTIDTVVQSMELIEQ